MVSRINCLTGLFGLLLLWSSASAPAATNYVKVGGSGNGSSWALAYSNIQDAFGNASDGDEVWIAEGTYQNDVDGTNSYMLTNANVSVYGGFAGSEGSVAARSGTDSVLDGQNVRRLIRIQADGVTLDRLTIQNGYHADSVPVNFGIGVYVSGITSSFTMRDCDLIKFRQQVLLSAGADVDIYGLGLAVVGSGTGTVLIEDCTIDDCKWSGASNATGSYGEGIGFYAQNVAQVTINGSSFLNANFDSGNLRGSGGGLALSDVATATISNTLVQGNAMLRQGGGGVRIEGTTAATFGGCTIRDNYTRIDNGGAGGGMLVSGASASVVLRKCIFRQNRCVTSGTGGGLRVVGGATGTVINCVFVENEVDAGGGGAISVAASTVTIRNSILYTNSVANAADVQTIDGAATLSYTWIDGTNSANCSASCTFGTGMINDPSGDPGFVNKAGWADLHLVSKAGHWTTGDVWVKDDETSPCVDAGDPSDAYALEPRANGGRVNIGLYGNTAQASKTLDAGTVLFLR
jgi:hypothetical protein